jgi:hypothetical protein
MVKTSPFGNDPRFVGEKGNGSHFKWGGGGLGQGMGQGDRRRRLQSDGVILSGEGNGRRDVHTYILGRHDSSINIKTVCAATVQTDLMRFVATEGF